MNDAAYCQRCRKRRVLMDVTREKRAIIGALSKSGKSETIQLQRLMKCGHWTVVSQRRA